LKQFVFFDRSGHFFASGRILGGGWFFCNSAHIFPFLLMVSPVRPVQRHDERPETLRTPMCDFLAKLALASVRSPMGHHFLVLAEDSQRAGIVGGRASTRPSGNAATAARGSNPNMAR
jgi:hypothetical protein